MSTIAESRGSNNKPEIPAPNVATSCGPGPTASPPTERQRGPVTPRDLKRVQWHYELLHSEDPGLAQDELWRRAEQAAASSDGPPDAGLRLRWRNVRLSRCWIFLLVTALVAGACGGDNGAEATILPATTISQSTATPPTTSATASTTPTTAVPLPAWIRVRHDETAFGGESIQWVWSVTAGGPGLVAVGHDGSGGDFDAAVWTSPDGITWSRVSLDEVVSGGSGEQVMFGVTAGGPGLVAVGHDGSGGDFDAAVWTSPDGITWSRAPLDEAVLGGPSDQAMFSVTAGGPGLVAVGYDGPEGVVAAAVWTSPDGTTWSRVPNDSATFDGFGDQWMQSVTVGGPGLVAVGWDGPGNDLDAAVWTSRDGITWSRVPHIEAVLGGPSYQAMVSVTAGGPGLVAVGFDGPVGDQDAAVWTSPDGFEWSRVPPDQAALGGDASQLMNEVIAGGPGLVAVGADFSGEGAVGAAVWISSDGIAWSRAPSFEPIPGGMIGQGMVSVTAGGPGLVAVGWEQPASDVNVAVWWSRLTDNGS